MKLITFILVRVCRLSVAFPRLILAVFLLVAVAGFAVMPSIKISTNLLAGVGETNPIINLTRENNSLFGEQDALIVVLQFPEPPGEERLPFIKGLAESIENVPGVRRVRHQFLDPENEEQLTLLFKSFLLGMNQTERDRIRGIFSPEGVTEALRRSRNRLFLAENPYLQKAVIQDPLELGQFVSQSMTKRVGAVSIGDIYLLIASPDSTVYLIQVTPDFPSTEILKGEALVENLRKLIPEKISELVATIPGMRERARGLEWRLTGKTVFHYESDVIFSQETLVILLVSMGLVMTLLLAVYRSIRSTLILMIPLVAGLGPNYLVIYFSYDEVNPVVMGAFGVLVGLGTEYGIHLWGRFTDEIDKGAAFIEALTTVFEQTGPAVLLGAGTTIMAFLCLCISDQPAMGQFGYVGASGLALTALSTLFLVPALASIVSKRNKNYFPRMRVSFKAFSTLFEKRPGTIVAVSGVVLTASIFFAFRVTYEEDLFKVFLAENMDSMSVSRVISRKFQVNFSQPTLLSFDADNFQEGLVIQRRLDDILAGLMDRDKTIASFDSISYLMAPRAVQQENIEVLSEIVQSWPKLETTLDHWLANSDLSQESRKVMNASFKYTGKILRDLVAGGAQKESALGTLERSWYTASINGKFRFLTQIRYDDEISNPKDLHEADCTILEAVKSLPVKVSISGPRQAMEQILSSIVSELFQLGLFAFVAVVLLFSVTFRNPIGVVLCLIPMTGAFCITLGVLGLLGMGLPFSIVGVAPLIFGLGIDNGIHVVMGSLKEKGGSIATAMARVTRPAILTSLTVSMGFISMVTSRHYSLQFLGLAMVVGMVAAAALTLTTLPALLLLLERRRNRRSQGPLLNDSKPDTYIDGRSN